MDEFDKIINSLSEDELDTLNSDPQLLAEFKAKYSQVGAKTTGLFGTHVGENSELLAAARKPAEVVRQGGKILSDSFDPQSRSVSINMLKNAPGTIADIGANLVASAIEPEALITEGAMKGLQYMGPKILGPIRAAGRWIGSQAEKSSGLIHKQPGVLAAATEDPGLMFGPGRSRSQVAYDAAKNESNIIRPEFKTMETKQDLVSGVLDALENRGITSQEALAARKALDKTKNHWSDEFYAAAREKLDRVAKKDFMRADAAHTKALKSEALRNVGSINKTAGTPSVLRNSLMAIQPEFAPLFSPMVQGGIASGIGVGNKAVQAAVESPAIAGIGMATLLDKYGKRNKEKDRDDNRKRR